MEKQVLHYLQGVSRGAGITNSTVTLSEGVNMGSKRSWNINGTLKQGTKFKFLPSFSCHPHSKSHRIFPSAKGAAGSVKCTQVLRVTLQLLSGSPIQARLQASEAVHTTSFNKYTRASSWAAAPLHPKELGWNSRNAHSSSAPATASCHYSQYSKTHAKGVHLPGFAFYMKAHGSLPCSDSTANELPALVFILRTGKLRSHPSSAFCPSHPPFQSHLISPFHQGFCGLFFSLFFRLTTQRKLGITFLFSTQVKTKGFNSL